MVLKEYLEKLRSGLLEVIYSNKNKENNPVETLDTKVDNFIEWYSKNLVKGYYTESGEYLKPRELRNLIEKMAVWYELRYPKYLVGDIIPCTSLEEKNVSASMFQRNPYINEQLEEDSDTRILDWERFYNFEAFLDSLPYEEKHFFEEIHYRETVYINKNVTSAHLHLDKDGYVKTAIGVSACLNYQISDKQMRGLHVKRILGMLKFVGFPLPADNELEEVIRYAENWQTLRNGILDCVMYRIIERGGSRIGPRRGLLYAKEFRRDIHIPMKYGVDTSDPRLRNFVNEYLKSGGSEDLVCYQDYFSRTDERSALATTTISSILDSTKYTEEENALHQRLVNSLSNGVELATLKKEKAKQLRIERKLEKSRNNTHKSW